MSTTSEDTLHRDVYAVVNANMSLEEARDAFWRLIPKEFHVTYDSLWESARPED